MGTRGSFESVAKVVVAFTRTRTWGQAELAREVGIQSRQLSKLLGELQSAGVPLEREQEHPHVYWSVPKGWLPGAVSLAEEQVVALLGLLSRLPAGDARDSILSALSPLAPALTLGDQIQHDARSGLAADQAWKRIPQALADKRPLRMRYRSLSGGCRTRVVSPQRILEGRAIHLLAICHESGILKRFHFDRIEAIEADNIEQYRQADPADLAEVCERAVNGFYDPAGPQQLCFHISAEVAIWAESDLPDGLDATYLEDGRLHVSGYVAGLDQVARYVVGLGAGAQAVTPQLREAVAELARGALLPSPVGVLEEEGRFQNRQRNICSVCAKRAAE